MGIREQMAAALSTVSGVKGYPYAPAARKVGDAWVRWNGDDRAAPGEFTATWQIVVLLPLDEGAGQGWIDAHRWPLTDALEDDSLVYVESMQPGVSADSPALMINCRE
jgi:hypothetical protein